MTKKEKSGAGAPQQVGSDGLRKTMGMGTAMSVVVGCVIGSGVFFKPQAIYTATGGAPGLGLLAWIVTGLVTLCSALTFSEIAILIPKTGGIVPYLTESFGDKVGFLSGWIQVLIFYPAMVAGLAVAFGNQAAVLLGNQSMAVPVAIGCILILTVLNCASSKAAGSIQIVFTICKLVPLVLLMVFGFAKAQNDAPLFKPMVGDGLNPVVVMGQLMIAVLFAFDGWTGVGAIAGEMKNPAKDLPKAIVGGVSVIMIIYLVVNIAYLKVLPASELAKLDAPASAVATVLFGSIGGKIIAVGIMVSVFGACNGFLLAGSRVTYAMAEKGTFPASSKLVKLNGADVPVNSVLLVAVIGAIFAISGQFNMLTDLAIFSIWIFYTLTFAAVIKLRKDWPDAERSYKVPLYPVIPIIAIVSGLFVIVNQLFLSGMHSTLLSLGSLAVLVVGLPVYRVMQNKMK